MPQLYLTTVVSLLVISAVLVSGAPAREKRYPQLDGPQWSLNEQEISRENRDGQAMDLFFSEPNLWKNEQARKQEYLEEQLAQMALRRIIQQRMQEMLSSNKQDTSMEDTDRGAVARIMKMLAAEIMRG